MGLFKRVVYPAIFFFFLTFLISMLSWLFVPERITVTDWVDGRNRNAFSLMNEPEDSIDVLVVGDSESFTSISPYRLWEKQRITSYVCGQTGQHVIEAYNMLKRAYESQSPKLVILEANELFTCAEPEENGLIQSVSPTIGFYLGLIKELCDDHGSQLLLVSVPSPKNWNHAKHEGVARYAQENGIPFLDLNRNAAAGELSLDWQQDSYDQGDHLNLRGAEKVTDYLGTYIEAHYDFFGKKRVRQGS